jgi:hypothetical protein
MPSVTLTKPSKWSWTSASIEEPTDATDLILLEPFWAEDDWALTNGATHTDLTGKTITITNDAGTDFDWVTDANVGPALLRVLRNTNSNGLALNDAGLNVTSLSMLYVIKRVGTDTGLWFAGGNNLYGGNPGLRFSSAGAVQVWDQGSGVVDASSTGTVPDGEWHVLGITFDTSTDVVKFFLDGASAGTGSSDRSFSNAVRRYFFYSGATTAVTQIGFALIVEWSGIKSDAFMEEITADPYRILREAGSGGGGDATGFRAWYTRASFVRGGGGLA